MSYGRVSIKTFSPDFVLQILSKLIYWVSLGQFSSLWKTYLRSYHISPNSVLMRENTEQNNSEYGHLLRSGMLPVNMDDRNRFKESDPVVYVRLSLYMEVYVRWKFQSAEKSDSIYSCRLWLCLWTSKQTHEDSKINKGITHSNSARTENTLAAPTLKEITCKVKIMIGLSRFRPMFPFYTPWKHQKIKGFLVFSGRKMRILARSGLSDVLESKHHQLKQSKGSLNLSKNISLVEPFDRYGYSFKKNKRFTT